MVGYDAFRMWVAMTQHFTTKSFDVFKNRGHMKCKFETYLGRDDYPQFEYISGKFKPNEFVLYLASNFMYGFPHMMYDYGSAVANYNLFLQRRHLIGHVVDNDLQSLYNINVDYKDGVSVIRALTKDQITFETVALINQYHNLTNQIRALPICSVLEPLLLRIDKSKGFIKIPPGVDQLLKNKLNIE